MHERIIMDVVKFIAGGGLERLESLAIRCYCPEDNLLQQLLNSMVEPVNEV
jgi:hypothetical protein